MGSYRSRLDIIADMLHVIIDNGKTKKTQIMYRANLSHKLLQKYLSEVLRADLICYHSKGRCYEITHRGEEFLEKYKNYRRHNKRLEEKIDELGNRRRILEKLSLRG